MENSRKALLNRLRQEREKFAVKKNWPGMLLVLNRMLDIDPSSKRFCALADLLRKLGCFEEAKKNYEDAIILNPDNEKAHRGLERVGEKIKHLERVFSPKMLSTYEELSTSSVKKIRQQIMNSICEQDWENAAHYCSELTELQATPIRFCMEAAMLIKCARWEEAVISYDKALLRDTHCLVAINGIERVKEALQERKRYELKIITLDPEPEDQFRQTFDDSMYLGIAEDKKKKDDDSSGEIIV
ncbi:tetratricopeptide repeat protein [Candidatus Uabimicrobium amorphum]|uniref:Tetratricopeptide repeat protein n=1 Tax=Uabimicrobium amorphum TaxID=2596890 RepID=A0A5S9IMR6_UABAM|nr:tetratricopeptide repeat protein [Candidatus Uabimicrobium amorphum]BBM84191.1 hypothetical protein UABAM_02547 [Candidatus Uabimicrobium amorphum]